VGSVDKRAGHLLGVALGDALGLYAEGLSTARATRLMATPPRFRVVPGVGVVSDDTEQTALVAEALISSGGDVEVGVRRFRRALVGWFLRLPSGIGLATARACLLMLAGVSRSGIASAGNGAAMRSGVIGVHFADDAAARRAWATRLAEVTHLDTRAVEAARYVAELAAACARASADADRRALVDAASAVVSEPSLLAAVESARALAGRPVEEAAEALGTSGFVVHTVGVTTWAFLAPWPRPLDAITLAIAAGGDADTHAAIVGGWAGALHGAQALPSELVSRLAPGPFGPAHLEALARGERPGWSAALAFARNLALLPVVVVQAVLRLVVAR
jgi:ADP-ribosyl-[dinitrogen reductase] hydrolase